MNAVFADGRVVDSPKADAAPFVTGGDQSLVDGRVNRQAENTVLCHLGLEREERMRAREIKKRT